MCLRQHMRLFQLTLGWFISIQYCSEQNRFDLIWQGSFQSEQLYLAKLNRMRLTKHFPCIRFYSEHVNLYFDCASLPKKQLCSASRHMVNTGALSKEIQAREWSSLSPVCWRCRGARFGLQPAGNFLTPHMPGASRMVRDWQDLQDRAPVPLPSAVTECCRKYGACPCWVHRPA